MKQIRVPFKKDIYDELVYELKIDNIKLINLCYDLIKKKYIKMDNPEVKSKKKRIDRDYEISEYNLRINEELYIKFLKKMKKQGDHNMGEIIKKLVLKYYLNKK